MIYRRLINYPSFGFRSPFAQLDRLRREFDRMIEDWPGLEKRSVTAGVFPQIKMSEDVGRFYIRAELPGVSSEDLDIQATAKSVSISGERKIPTENDGVRYHRRERDAGQFSRIIGMPSEIDPDKIEAGLKNGILTVFVPKAEAAKPRQIKIN